MTRALLLIVLLLLPCAFLTIAPAQSQQDDDVIRVETDLTNVLFTAVDRRNKFITTLQEQDLQISEDGVRQTILAFQRETDRPLSLAFLIDVSASEEKTLPQEKAAARAFIETVLQSSKDQAAVIAFTGSSFLEQKLTRDVFPLYRALERVEIAMPAYLGDGKPISGIPTGPGLAAPPPDGTTAIYEAVALAASEILSKDDLNAPVNRRRRAIILLTDGWDTSSRIKREDAVSSALAAEAVIYAIGIGGSRDGIDKNGLYSMAVQTGGRAFFPKKEKDLMAAFAEIEQELRSQYLIAYSSTNKRKDGGYRRMQIQVVNPELQNEKLQLRYRPGYYARPLTSHSREK